MFLFSYANDTFFVAKNVLFFAKKMTFFYKKKLLFFAKKSTFFYKKKLLFFAKKSTFFCQKKVFLAPSSEWSLAEEVVLMLKIQNTSEEEIDQYYQKVSLHIDMYVV